MLVENVAVEAVVLVVAAPARALARHVAAVLRHMVAHVDEAQLLIALNMLVGEHHPRDGLLHGRRTFFADGFTTLANLATAIRACQMVALALHGHIKRD